MKNKIEKIASVLKTIFGYGIMSCLFLGGLTFVGYVIALIAGGETAVIICDFIYKTIMPIIIYASNIFVLLGLVILYMSGEKALSVNDKNSKKEKAAS